RRKGLAMQDIRIDLSRVADIDPLAMGQRVTRPPRISVPPSLLDTLKGGLRQYSATPTRPGAAMLGDMLTPNSRKPRITFVGAIKKAVFPPSKDVTVGIGPGYSTASVISVGAGFECMPGTRQPASVRKLVSMEHGM